MELRPESSQDEADEILMDRQAERLKANPPPSPQEQQEQEAMASEMSRLYALRLSKKDQSTS